MIKINDVELQFDVMDADHLEKYEAALLEVKNTKLADGLTASQRIKEQCKIVKNFFDKVCGPQTSEKIFGDSHNYRTHYEAFESFVMQANAEAEAEQKAIEDRAAKYTLNRAQRRAK